MCTCPNPPPQILWELHKLKKGKYNPNNPITHVPCARTVNQLARGYTPIGTEKFMACLEEGVISVCVFLGDE